MGDPIKRVRRRRFLRRLIGLHVPSPATGQWDANGSALVPAVEVKPLSHHDTFVIAMDVVLAKRPTPQETASALHSSFPEAHPDVIADVVSLLMANRPQLIPQAARLLSENGVVR